jgi:hypothetical protein
MTEFVHLTKQFARRRFLKTKAALEFRETDGRPRLYCAEPAIAARFASQLRQAALARYGPATKVLMRGQSHNHSGMVPGLFRPPTHALARPSLLHAEKLFEQRIRQLVKLGRFERPRLAALLQHYGYRTTWLDVVDNLWVAVWFATNLIGPADKRSRASTPRTTGSGWIYFIAATERTNCEALDLRNAHHGLSLRPHAQSGWSVRSIVPEDGDLSSGVIGCVEFPITERWAFGGHLGSSEFLFPSRALDDTLKRLIEHDGDAIAAAVERESRVPNEALGRLYEVKQSNI